MLLNVEFTMFIIHKYSSKVIQLSHQREEGGIIKVFYFIVGATKTSIGTILYLLQNRLNYINTTFCLLYIILYQNTF